MTARTARGNAVPAGIAHLTAEIQAAANPKQPVPALPPLARLISGKTYRFADNPYDVRAWTFNFQVLPDGTVEHILETSPMTQTLSIGLDGRYAGSAGLNSTGLRGHWANDNTFIIEAIPVGQVAEYEYRLTFNANDLEAETVERVFGGEPVKLHATLEN